MCLFFIFICCYHSLLLVVITLVPFFIPVYEPCYIYLCISAYSYLSTLLNCSLCQNKISSMQNVKHPCKWLAALRLGVKSSVERGLLFMKVKPLSAKMKGWPNELQNVSSNIIKERAAKRFHMIIIKCFTNQYLQV